jgi:predicted HTH transcriptional regulator
MTDRELEDQLDDLESDRVERKESHSDSDKVRQAVCAFANDLPDHRLPGVLFIGANDRGEGAGLKVTDQLLLTLSNMRSDGNILPFPSMTVTKRTFKGHEMAVVEVQPSDSPPVRFKGTVWIRVGPRRGIASADDERRLSEKRRFRDIPADIRPLVSASLDAVDFTSSSMEVRKPDYPLVALQQIARNAVLHRSYENTNAPVRLYWFDDRVEIQNPGGPYGQVTRANFGAPGISDYRNPNLAAVMKDLGFVQRFGMGIAIARQAMAANGNPPVEFQVEDTHVAAILRGRP